MNWKLIVEYENDYYAHHTNHYLCHGQSGDSLLLGQRVESQGKNKGKPRREPKKETAAWETQRDLGDVHVWLIKIC